MHALQGTHIALRCKAFSQEYEQVVEALQEAGAGEDTRTQKDSSPYRNIANSPVEGAVNKLK